MQMCCPADWSDLTVAERSRHRQVWHQLTRQADVAIGSTKQPLAPSQAGHEQSEVDRVARISCRCFEQGNGFVLRGRGFAQVKLHVLAGAHPLSNGHGAIVGIDSCLLYTSPSPRDRTRSRMPSSA